MADDREHVILAELSADKETLVDGELFIKVKQWRVLRRVLASWIGKDLEVSLKILRYTRSAAQNRWLWGVAIPCIRAFNKETTGVIESPEAIYAFIQSSVLEYELKSGTFMGKDILYFNGKKLKEMNTVEFTEAMQKIVDYFDKLGCYIPLPAGNGTLNDYIKAEDEQYTDQSKNTKPRRAL